MDSCTCQNACHPYTSCEKGAKIDLADCYDEMTIMISIVW